MIVRNLLLLMLSVMSSYEVFAQARPSGQHIAICVTGKGCKFSEMKMVPADVDKLLGKNNFWVSASPHATLILENCESKIEEDKSLAETDRSYGGAGKVDMLPEIDLRKYIKEKGCFACPNETMKISFYARAGGEEPHAGNGYFYLNLKAGEAYMPHDAFRQFYSGQEGYDEVVVDQFLRNNKIEQFMISEGRKIRHSMPVGTSMTVSKNDALNEQKFKKDFKKTGNTRKHLNTTRLETEYIGRDDEGGLIHFWIVPEPAVCLPSGKFDASGFFNLGYISVDGISYLVTEISGTDFQIKLTGIAPGSYGFDPSGYQSF